MQGTFATVNQSPLAASGRSVIRRICDLTADRCPWLAKRQWLSTEYGTMNHNVQLRFIERPADGSLSSGRVGPTAIVSHDNKEYPIEHGVAILWRKIFGKRRFAPRLDCRTWSPRQDAHWHEHACHDRNVMLWGTKESENRNEGQMLKQLITECYSFWKKWRLRWKRATKESSNLIDALPLGL